MIYVNSVLSPTAINRHSFFLTNLIQDIQRAVPNFSLKWKNGLLLMKSFTDMFVKNHYSSLYLGFNNKEFTNELTVTS